MFILDQKLDEKKWDNLIRFDSRSNGEIDFREMLYNPFSITSCTFSSDGHFLLSGHRNGLVRLWDTAHGQLIARVERTHQTQVAACVFKEKKIGQYTVLSCCRSGRLVQWDLSDLMDERSTPIFKDFKDNWNSDSMRVDDAWPSFSADRKLVAFRLEARDNWFHDLDENHLVFPSSTEVEDGERNLRRVCFLYIYETQLHGEQQECPMQATIVWEADRHFKASSCVFSPIIGRTSFLVGFRSPEHCGFICLWPDFKTAAQQSFKLSGACGSWSCDGKRLVTWDPLSDVQSRARANICEVWMVDKLMPLPENELHAGKTGLHPKFMPQKEDACIVLQHDPGVRILWCQYVNCPKPLVASCVVDDNVKVLIWDLDVEMPMHVLTTLVHVGVSTDQWAEQLVRGINSIAVSADGVGRIGFYMGCSKQGFIWNAEHGFEYLRFSLPDELVDNRSGFQLQFSPDGGKFLVQGSDSIMIWNTAPFRKATSIGASAALFRTEQETLSPLNRGVFSYNGEKIGLLQADCDTIFIYDFVKNRMLDLSQMPVKESTVPSNLFSAFSFSLDGRYFVSCMKNGEVLVWPLTMAQEDGSCGSHESNDFDLVCADRRFERLGSIQQTCKAVCFSRDEAYQETVVVCGRDGTLYWFDVKLHDLVDSRKREGRLACKFSNDGSRGALFEWNGEAAIVKLWDLVARTKIQEIVYGAPLQQIIGFPHNISMDGTFAVVGIGEEMNQPVMFRPGQLPKELKIDRAAQKVVVSDDGNWVVTDDFISVSIAFWGPYSPQRGMDLGDKNKTRLATSEQRIWVMAMDGKSHTKSVQGRHLDPNRFMVVSSDGTKIACAAEQDKFMVWTPWAVQGCIPDYEALKTTTNMDDLNGLDALLNEFGPAILNYPNELGLSIFLHAIKEDNQEWVDRMIEWALENGVKASMVTYPHNCVAEFNCSPRTPTNGLQLAIDNRSPAVIRSLINGLLLGLTTKHTLAQIFQESLLNLSSVYPSLLLELIGHDYMLQVIGKVCVAEELFHSTAEYITGTSTTYAPPQSKVLELWRELNPKVEQTEGKALVHAEAKVFPYPEVARIGMRGILRPLLVNDAPAHIYSSKPLRCVISYKWRAYAQHLLYEEVTHYMLMLLFFTIYNIVLGYETMQKETAEDFARDGRSIVSLVSLVLAAFLALAHLLREIKQIIVYVREGQEFGFNGINFWLNSKWNLLEIISLTMVIFCLPFLRLGKWIDSRADEIESGVAAMTSIMLWWKSLYYAQAFRKTGPLVIMIFEIIKDMMFFLATAAGVFVAFGFAFFVIFRHDIEQNEMDMDDSVFESFGSVDRSLLTTFGMMLGDFDTSLFYTSRLAPIALLLFVLYMITMMIILLNLLIAIMVSILSEFNTFWTL